MNPLVSIIMGSTSDLPVMESAAKIMEEFEIPFEMNALSAHRTPEKVETPRDYGIVEAVFYVFNSIQPSATLKDYLKDLSMYFFEGGPFMLVKI